MKNQKDIATELYRKAVIKAFKDGWNACIAETVETLPKKMKV